MMWTIFKTKRLTLLTILAGLTYVFMIFNSLFNGWDDTKGYYEGNKVYKYDSHGKIPELESLQSIRLSLKLRKSFSYFPDSMINLKSRETIKTQFTDAIVLGPVSSLSPNKAYFVFQLFIAIILLITYTLLPIHFYKLFKPFKKELVFERKNIHLLRLLGFELLTIYFGIVLFNFMNYKINCSLIGFSKYELVMDSIDGIWLLFGIVALLIAEILSKALGLKEEQELTI